MLRSKNGFFKNKYLFQDLDIGENKYLLGDIQSIRSAASKWGTRYGIWLSCSKLTDGRIKITRLFSPSTNNKKKYRDSETQRLDDIEKALGELKLLNKDDEAFSKELQEQRHALRALTLLVLNCKNLLEEITSNQLPKEKIVYDPYENRT